jgi:hypothetical protein
MKAKGNEAWISCVFLISTWIAGVELAASEEQSGLAPRQVVEQWLQVYPGKIEQAADLTTAAFREGKSKEEWIATREPFLQDLGMKYVRAKIVHEETVADEARVMVHAHIVTVMGDQPQDELYILVSTTDHGWLIDQVEVYTEMFNRLP